MTGARLERLESPSPRSGARGGLVGRLQLFKRAVAILDWPGAGAGPPHGGLDQGLERLGRSWLPWHDINPGGRIQGEGSNYVASRTALEARLHRVITSLERQTQGSSGADFSHFCS